ncbi:MAG: hypothetical protein SFY70_13535 [Bacteroidia bacterium]|nr:hypothetical protein [Bacteroidia bacterium]
MALRGVSLGSKTIEYLLELGLVVLGISASFWIENYREALGELKIEQEYLQGLREDLGRDTVALIAYRERQLARAEGCFALLRYVDTGTVPPDTFLVHFFAIINYQRFETHANTLREMESAGQFRLLRDRDLRKGILELQNLYVEVETAQEHQRYDQYEHLYPDLFRGPDFRTLLKGSSAVIPPTELQAFQGELKQLYKNRHFLNSLLVIGSNAQQSISNLEIALEQSRRLLRRIEGQLKKAR